MKQEYHRALEQICLSEEARARIISVLEQKERGLKRPRRRIGRLILVCAVLILLLLGTGAAVVSRVGVLELFFQGDTSQLEPFVQTGASAQDKNYRLTLDSSICDGDTLYVVITVEGLHEQAVENLKNNQVVADCYRAAWGREMPGNLMEQGQGDISVFQFQMEAGNHMSSFGFEELPAPSETSRSWQLQLTLTGLEHPQTEPIGLRLGFMEESCVLQIPVDQMPQVVRVSIARELSVDWNGGVEVFADHVEFGPTRFTYVGKYPDTASSLAPLVFFRMKDGQILTRKQMGLELEMRDIPGPANVFGKELAEIVYTSRSVMDLTEIASVILGTAEFSLNGEPLGEVQMKEQLYPFSIEVGEGGAEYAGPYAASMEELCKKLGAEYQWDEINKRATGVYQGISLSLTAGESLALVNGERKEIETRVRGKDGVFTQVPMPAVEYHGGISAAILFFGEVWGLEFQVLDGEIIVVP